MLEAKHLPSTEVCIFKSDIQQVVFCFDLYMTVSNSGNINTARRQNFVLFILVGLVNYYMQRPWDLAVFFSNDLL